MSSHILEATPVSELALPEVRKDGSASKSVIVAPAALLGDDEPVTTRRELWCYYLFQFGNNALGPKGLATAAGYDPVRGPGSSCLAPRASRTCVLPWGSGTKEVSSIALIATGLGFAIMALVFATIGPAADYRTFGRWLLLVSTAICWAAQFASMALTSPSRWGAAMAMYIISFASQGIVTAFFGAIFPQLARNTPHSRELRMRHERGELSLEAYEKEKSIEKSKISSVGMVFALPLNLSLLLPLSDNPKVDNYVIVLSTGYWVLFGIWWSSARAKLPKGGSYLTGMLESRSFVALKQYKKLPNTFAYLCSSFLLFGLSYGMYMGALIPVWGMIGIWTDKFGFHNSWEFWVYNVMFGLAVGPNYAISQTMMCELSPPGFEYMLLDRMIQAIINKNGNNWKAFPIMAVLIALACLVALFWVDVPKGRSAAVQWATERRSTSDYEVYSESDGKDSESSKSEGKSKGNI
ncbi:vacuole effluxer Atg22 like-domain-containing protein [Lactarius hatsudake]|nr:vacuole effluxer Atg22 like-domain-containing protein [Lactarius hatsudake]